METKKNIDKLFSNLDKWRGFPKYQLERRVDIFFTLYLKNIVESNLNNEIKLNSEIFPEFPILKKLLDKKEERNHSINTDYLMFSEDLSNAFFVELKTDIKSIPNKREFNEYNSCIKSLTFEQILMGIFEICKTTNEKQKYINLIQRLAQNNLLEFSYPNIDILTNNLVDIETKIKILKSPDKIDMIWIVPNKSNHLKELNDDSVKIITFNEIYQDLYNQNDDDYVKKVFLEHLLNWRY
jgi:general stress protein 26